MKALVSVGSALLFLLLSLPLRGQQWAYYVNGASGVNAPGAGSIGTMTPGANFPPPPPFVLPQGYKTIGFAMAQAQAYVAASPGTRTARIFIQGGQTYSLSTNAEVYPIVMAAGVGLEGTFVGLGFTSLPVLAASAGTVALQFDGSASYTQGLPSGGVTLQSSDHSYLSFSGGSRGVSMGALVGFRHRPRFDHCEFVGQTVAGFEIVSRGTAIDDPKIYRSNFSGSPTGIDQKASGNGSISWPDIQDCSFTGITGTAYSLSDTSSGGANVGSQVQSCRFSNCSKGIYITSGGGATSTNSTIRNCAFSNISLQAIEIALNRPVDPNVVIDQCGMDNCAEGVRLSGQPSAPTGGWGLYDLRISNTSMRGCTGAGIRLILQSINAPGTIWCRVRSNNNEIRQSNFAFLIDAQTALAPGQEDLLLDFQSARDLVHQCVYGASLNSGWIRKSPLPVQPSPSLPGWSPVPAQALVGFDSAMLLGPGTSGVLLQAPSTAATSPASITPAQIRSCTIADYFVGMTVSAFGAGSSFHHNIFDNALNVSLAASANLLPINQSCFHPRGGTWASRVGSGNIFADPQLISHVPGARVAPEFHHLAPTSPCIDAGSAVYSLPTTDFDGQARAQARSLGASAIPDIGADEYSYTGTGALFGTTGFSSYDLIPHMATSNTSFVAGSPLTLNLTNAVMPVFGVAAPFAILLMGTSSLPGPGLPFALNTLGCTGSWNWTNSLVWTSVVPIASAGAGIGTASLTLSTPSAIAGSIFTFQWFVIAPTSYPCVTTEGLRVHF